MSLLDILHKRQRQTDVVEVDQRMYHGVDFEAANRVADKLDEVQRTHGDDVMAAHAAGIPVEEARRYGGSSRPQAH